MLSEINQTEIIQVHQFESHLQLNNLNYVYMYN